MVRKHRSGQVLVETCLYVLFVCLFFLFFKTFYKQLHQRYEQDRILRKSYGP